MTIQRSPRPDADYYVLANTISRDSRLSWKARGLLVYLLSMPDNWKASTRHLQSQGPEGADAVRSGLKELEDAGYLVRTRSRDEKGQWVHFSTIYETPQVNPNTGNPNADIPNADLAHIEEVPSEEQPKEEVPSFLIIAPLERNVEEPPAQVGQGQLLPTVIPPKRQRSTDETWETVLEVCQINPTQITKAARGNYNQAVKQLKDVGATPEDIRFKAAAYRISMPQVTLTPSALAKHWAALEGYVNAPTVGKNASAVTRAAMKFQAEDRRQINE